MSRPKRAIRRILVALDAATHAPGCIDCIAALAARLHAELTGLFVEDLNLLRSAELPFVSEIRLSSAEPEHFDVASTEQHLRQLAREARQSLAAAAERERIAWSFRVVRQQMARALEAAAPEADILVMLGTRPLAGRLRPAPAVRAILARAGRPVLVLRSGEALESPIQVVYDGSPAANRALAVGEHLAAGVPQGLRVVLCAPDAQALTEVEKQARERMELDPSDIEWVRLRRPGLAALQQALTTPAAGVVVVDAGLELADGKGIDELVSQTHRPVLLVR